MAFRPQHFLRMANLARRTPSARLVAFFLGILAVCVGLALLERTFGWPDWLIPNSVPGGRI